MQFNALGEIIRANRPVGAYHTMGAVRQGFRRLNLAEAFSQADPGGRLAAPITDGGEGVGISFPLTGGWSSTDPLSGWPNIIWRARDLFGYPVGASDVWAMVFELAERTAPGLASDTAVCIGVINESADSATIDGYSSRFLYSGATRNMAFVSLAAGVPTVSGGVASANMRYQQFVVGKFGAGATAMLAVVENGLALDAARAPLASGLNPTATPAFGDAEPWLFLAAGRTAVTAGNETPIFDAYVVPQDHAPLRA